MAYRERRGTLGRAFPPTVQPQTIPASVGGINAHDSLMGMPVQDCIYTYNLIPSEYGLRLRKGFREWATGVPSDVRTIIPYDDQTGGGSDKLFAVCAEGIYDVTLFNTTAPVQVVDFVDSGPSPDGGYGVYAHFTSDNGTHILMYADNVNGLWYYNLTPGVWERPTINGPDVTNVAFVTVHKQRVWMVEDGGEDAWYLGVDAILGDATKFNFGSKFPHGGRLMGLWSWTLDGGDGVDDFMVAISRAGDVLMYYGSDPSQPDWSLRGSWYIGEVPNSRRIAAHFGGELFVLSSFGVISLKQLVAGVDFATKGIGPGAKIARYLREEVRDKIDSPDWKMEVYPAEGFLQISAPWKDFNVPPRQYTMNLSTSAWGWWRGVPMLDAAPWTQEYIIGAPDGIVYILDGGLDNTMLDGTIGLPIEFRTLTSFQPYGNHAQFMRPGFIRTIAVTESVTALNTKAVFDYKFNTVIEMPPAVPRQSATIWDTGLWDVDYWDYSPDANSLPLGASGLGRVMAVGLAGSSEQRLTIVGWDVMFTTGGLL